jgi:hypothetical protein
MGNRNYVPDVDRNEIGEDVDLPGCVSGLFAMAASSMPVFSIPIKKARAGFPVAPVSFSLIYSEYQIEGGNYDMISNFIFGMESAG